MIISRTPFRISLFGGGTDYPAWFREHGGAVVGTAIDKYCYITVRRLPPFFEHRSRIVYSQVKLGPDWTQWKPAPAAECLAPEKDWEGANLPLTAGKIGAVDKPIRALRDPALFEDSGKVYLLYAIAGESGLAISEVSL